MKNRRSMKNVWKGFLILQFFFLWVGGTNELVAKTIVITGASGHVGAALVEDLLKDEDTKIRAIYWGHPNRVEKVVKPEQRHRVEYYQVDVRDREALKEVFRGADAVVHLAAMIWLHEDQTKLKQMREVNVDGTRNVLEAMIATGVKSLVHCSTTHAYKHLPDRPLSLANGLVDEKQMIYDSTKADGQRLVREYGKKYSELGYVVIAPSGVIGRHDHEDTEMWPMFERHSIVRFSPIPTGGYAFVDVRQVAYVMRSSIEQLQNPKQRARISGQEFIVAGNVISIPNFFKTMQRVTGKAHCLNLGCFNAPVVLPIAVLQGVAPLCEKAASLAGMKSPIARYSMDVLASLPKGVAESEYQRLEKYFGKAALPYDIALTLKDRYAQQRSKL